jgi:hypothetical protein
VTLSTPEAVLSRLEAIEHDLAELQNGLEDAALAFYRAKRDREKAWADAFLTAKGTDGARKALAQQETAEQGKEEEAAYEARKAVLRVLETRASVGQSILRSQGRA